MAQPLGVGDPLVHRVEARSVAGVALIGAALLGAAACANGDDAPAATTVTIKEVGLAVRVPGQLADLTYAMGEAEEGQPAVYFSTRRLERAGGPACEAGASAAVSPYPLGQIVVSDETPRHVREEFRDNPEESLGRFLVRAGDEYVYYSAPPDEPCYVDADVADLQQRLAGDLKDALASLEPAGG
jgi:hypothetical protein